MADLVKQMLMKQVQMADQVAKVADAAGWFKQDCAELKSKAERLADLLRQAARSSSDLYDRPTRRIVDDADQTLRKALSLLLKCRGGSPLKRLFAVVHAAALRKISARLDTSIGDVSWLLRVSASVADDGDGRCLGLPPVAANEPILCLIWEQIAILHNRTLAVRSDAAASLASLARDNHRYGRLIVEEGGVGPLLRLLKEGETEGRVNAARAIGFLGRDAASVEQMMHAGVCSAFAKILKEGAVKVQAAVAWALAELAANHPECTDTFARHNIIRLLVSHLETVEDHSADASNCSHRNGGDLLAGPSGVKGSREFEDPATKSHLKAMATAALWRMAKENPAVCRSITESRALLCFKALLDKETEDVRFPAAMALMEITAVAEKDADLRRWAFKPSSPACKAIVDQLLTIIENSESNLLVPCIKAIGNLARIFQATERRMIGPLVRLLDDPDTEVCGEAGAALAKFACSDNYLHVDHSRAIIAAGAAGSLVRVLYSGEPVVQIPALVLLSHVAVHVPEIEELARAEVPAVLAWASKQGHLVQEESVERLLQEAIRRLEV